MDEMFDRLQALVDRYDELNELISDPEIIADTQRFMKLSKEEGELRDTVEAYRKYQKVTGQIDEDNEMLHEKLDDDMSSMVKDELKELEDKKKPSSRNRFASCYCLRILTMIRTSSWKSMGLPVVMKPAYLQLTCLICIPATLKSRAGRWKSLIRMRPKSAVSRKSFY